MSESAERKLVKLGIELPELGQPVANFLPYVRSGNLLFISGQVPTTEGGSLLAGHVNLVLKKKTHKW